MTQSLHYQITPTPHQKHSEKQIFESHLVLAVRLLKQKFYFNMFYLCVLFTVTLLLGIEYSNNCEQIKLRYLRV